jgi:hypothetical protein
MKFVRQCTRYTEGKCRLTGYKCGIKHERGESHAITALREIVCYWFTRDPTEGLRISEKLVN